MVISENISGIKIPFVEKNIGASLYAEITGTYNIELTDEKDLETIKSTVKNLVSMNITNVLYKELSEINGSYKEINIKELEEKIIKSIEEIGHNEFYRIINISLNDIELDESSQKMLEMLKK